MFRSRFSSTPRSKSASPANKKKKKSKFFSRSKSHSRSIRCLLSPSCSRSCSSSSSSKSCSLSSSYRSPSIPYDRLLLNRKTRRACTDIFCTVCFFVFIIAWIAMIYFIVIGNNSATSLMKPTDSFGNTCGYDRYSDRPFLFFFNLLECGLFPFQTAANGCQTPQVCVRQCPNVTFSVYNQIELSKRTNRDDSRWINQVICLYGIKPNISNIERLIRENKCASLYFGSDSLFGRCIPTIIQFDSDNQAINELDDSPLKYRVNETMSVKNMTDNWMIGLISFANFTDNFFPDISKSLTQIFLILLFGAIISSLWILNLHYFARIIVWCSIVALLVIFAAAFGYSFYRYRSISAVEATQKRVNFADGQKEIAVPEKEKKKGELKEINRVVPPKGKKEKMRDKERKILAEYAILSTDLSGKNAENRSLLPADDERYHFFRKIPKRGKNPEHLEQQTKQLELIEQWNGGGAPSVTEYLYLYFRESVRNYIDRWLNSPGFWLTLVLIVGFVLFVYSAVIFALWNRINLAIRLIENTSRAISSIRGVLLIPLIPLALKIVFFALFSTISLLIYGAGRSRFLTANFRECTPNNNKGYGGDDENGDDDGCLLRQVISKQEMIIAQVFNFFLYLWISEFIAGFYYMSLSYSYAAFYWIDQNRRLSPLILLRSARMIFRFHIGTLAFGSALISTLYAIRKLAYLIVSKVKNNFAANDQQPYLNQLQNPINNNNARDLMIANPINQFMPIDLISPVKISSIFGAGLNSPAAAAPGLTPDNTKTGWSFRFLYGALWFLERLVALVSYSAYTMCAIQGTAFVRSAIDAFLLLFTNTIASVTVTMCAAFIIGASKWSLVAIVIAAGHYLISAMQDGHKSASLDRVQLNSIWPPIIISGYISYAIISLYLNVYKFGVETMFMCYLIDVKEGRSRRGQMPKRFDSRSSRSSNRRTSRSSCNKRSCTRNAKYRKKKRSKFRGY